MLLLSIWFFFLSHLFCSWFRCAVRSARFHSFPFASIRFGWMPSMMRLYAARQSTLCEQTRRQRKRWTTELKFFWRKRANCRRPQLPPLWRQQTHKNGYIIIVLEFKENLLWHHRFFFLSVSLTFFPHSPDFGIFLCTMYSHTGSIHSMFLRLLSHSLTLTLFALRIIHIHNSQISIKFGLSFLVFRSSMAFLIA